MPGRDDDRLDGSGARVEHRTPRAAESVDPLTRQLREMYGAIAEEPIPETILVVLERLRQQH